MATLIGPLDKSLSQEDRTAPTPMNPVLLAATLFNWGNAEVAHHLLSIVKASSVFAKGREQ